MEASGYEYDLAVIGGGPAGVTAAFRANELGAERVLLIERDRLGGVCTNDGCVPMRVLAKAARLLRDARQADAFGIVGSAPGVDIGRLMERVESVRAAVHDKKAIAERLTAAGVDLIIGQGAARFIGPHTLVVGEEALFTARRVLLCGGGHAARPPFEGAGLAHSHSDLWALKGVPRRVVVVGAAATGCQAASILREFGAEQVTLIDTAVRILPQEDAFVSDVVRAGFESRGVRVLTGTKGVSKIEEMEGGARRVTVGMSDGSVDTIEAEMVLLCMGWPANLEPLNLGAADVATERGYIAVDDTLRSVSAPHVYAAGDMNGRLMLVQTATDQARIAAENALRGTEHTDGMRIVPHGGFTDPEYASVGMTEHKARELEPDCLVATAHLSEMDRAVIDGHTEGGCKLIVSRASRRILGAHVAGEEAMEVIHLCAGAMAGDLTVDRLARLELAYPTYSAVVGRAARDICREMELIPGAPAGTDVSRSSEWEFGSR